MRHEFFISTLQIHLCSQSDQCAQGLFSPAVRVPDRLLLSAHGKNVKTIERVQRYFTQRIPYLNALRCSERLAEYELTSLENGRTKSDLVFTYRLVYAHLCLDYSAVFSVLPVNGR